MEISSHHLQGRLQDGQLASLYYVAGTDLLLMQESIQTLVTCAQKHGFDEIIQMEVGTKEEWESAFLEAQGSSLFAEKRTFDLSMKTNAIDRSSISTIKSYLSDPNPDIVLLVRGKTFEYRHRSSAWFRLLLEQAVVVICEPLPPAQFSQWIANRAQEKQLSLSRDAVEEIADLTEGNLLAANQEIERLHLTFLDSEEEISSEELNMQNWSSSSPFELIDAACLGQTSRMNKSLMALSRDGTEPLSIIGLIALQLRRMHAVERGERINMSQRRMKPIEVATRRLGLENIKRLMVECTNIDSQRKGVLAGDAWNSVCSLLVGIAGSQDVPTIEPRIRWHTIDYDA
ncbi:MAG: DNA polymerase III subunit delta [Gammaproteobacteria bacterium]|nr:DNA polymerase III subunit delta [Gammaproteobacteria bacterium]